MNRSQARALVDHLLTMVGDGYTIITWNGLGFDFDVLAEESGAHRECSQLATEHVDLMFHAFAVMGFPVALDRAARGMDIGGKFEGISGALAPRLWAEGQTETVMRYVAQDVRMLAALAEACERCGEMRWVTRKGSLGRMPLPDGWLRVHDAHRLPLPDVSWMDDPWPRSRFSSWLIEPLLGPASGGSSSAD